MDKLVYIALKTSHNNGILTYNLPAHLGDALFRRVSITLKNREVTGLVIEENVLPPKKGKIKDIIKIVDEKPVLTKEQFALIKFCAEYYFNPLGYTLHSALPKNEKAPKELLFSLPKAVKPHALNQEQQEAVNAILKEPSGGFLLEGVTGSGKTHVYVEVARETLKQGRSVLFIAPEIALTTELVHRLEASLGQKAIVLHSNITGAKKRDAIFALLQHEMQIVIGARSAIFAPAKKLGLIVVDEEHDQSLKQDEMPRYNARDLALYRGKLEEARVILGSATPSLESVYNAKNNKIRHLVLTTRFGKKALPKVEIIDLKKRSEDVFLRNADESITGGQKMCILSRPLVEEMRVTLARGAQVLLFLNQRGYAKFGVCYDCGQVVECINCSVGMTYYQNRNLLLCHQCDYREQALITCRNCCHDSIKYVGLGTERLEEEVRTLFKDYSVIRLDRDIVRSTRRLKETLHAMHERKADILIGTQMIAKGHDFKHVALVGIVCADVALSLPDFRAQEKTFQLLTQVSGRAGRGDFSGKALIQTFNPDHPSIHLAKEHNVRDFVELELGLRKRFFKPPFARAAMIRVEHQHADTALLIAERVKHILHSDKSLVILGPTPSPIERINNRYRFQCMLESKDVRTLHKALNLVVSHKTIIEIVSSTRARFIVDVDPYNLC